jgi:5'-methylthioadenosine phosphorylase
MEGLDDVEEVRPVTPFGAPSDTILIGTLEGERVAFLPRHGDGHRILPTEVPFRANIWALKDLGVERIIAISAVGSLRKEIAPFDLVVPDQLVDRTRVRDDTFFGRGLVAHVAFDEPFCPVLSSALVDAAGPAGTKIRKGATWIVVEGPAFSTKAESRLYRSWDADVIGMTAIPEAKLAREAEICYAPLAHVTDYDNWDDAHEPVSAELIIKNILANVDVARQMIREVIRTLPAQRDCACASALAKALITAPDRVPEETKRELAPIIGQYMPVGAVS